MHLRPLVLAALATATACSSTVQTSSGADYLTARSFSEPGLAAVAAVEPDLQFPARIGLARIDRGSLALAPAAETAVWDGLIAAASPLGEVVPLMPLMASLVPRASGAPTAAPDTLRRLAARQHLDYLLVVDLSDPGGTAQAAFIDVRNGYPYGTAQIAVPGAQTRGFFGPDPETARLSMARALVPEIVDMLNQLAARARRR